MSSIPSELIELYRTAVYRVDAPEGVLTLHIDLHSRELADLHAKAGVTSSAFLTAYHPRSNPVSPEENESAQQALLDDLKTRGLRWLEGRGEDAAGQWPAEPSVLVLGIAPKEATDLAKKYQQNGYVFCGADAIPRLVLTR